MVQYLNFLILPQCLGSFLDILCWEDSSIICSQLFWASNHHFGDFELLGSVEVGQIFSHQKRVLTTPLNDILSVNNMPTFRFRTAYSK